MVDNANEEELEWCGKSDQRLAMSRALFINRRQCLPSKFQVPGFVESLSFGATKYCGAPGYPPKTGETRNNSATGCDRKMTGKDEWASAGKG